jgi:hypothetical protein
MVREKMKRQKGRNSLAKILKEVFEKMRKYSLLTSMAPLQ